LEANHLEKKPLETNKFDLFKYHSLFNQNVQISYKGPFESKVLSVLGNYIRFTIGKNPKASKKIFNIFIELAQNIAHYSAEKNLFGVEEGVGSLVIAEYSDYYAFSTGNIVKNEDVIVIIEKIELINSLDREQLREYKRVQRNLPQREKGNANIGLIQVALTSANPLDIEVTLIDDKYSFFAITVKVDK
jgi:hypothetical protein